MTRRAKPRTLSPTTRELVKRLDIVIASLADPGNTLTENELMAEHVRSVLNGEDEPLFTEPVLKMAFTEMIYAERQDDQANR